MYIKVDDQCADQIVIKGLQEYYELVYNVPEYQNTLKALELVLEDYQGPKHARDFIKSVKRAHEHG